MIPRHYKWTEGIRHNKDGEVGSIWCESTPVPVWLIGEWLEHADDLFHRFERLFPADKNGWSWIDRLDPYYGNPICAAWTLVVFGWVHKHTKYEVQVDVPIEKLSTKFRAWYKKTWEGMA